ncbi:MAG: peptidoglycan DD-metalloendopeptidase family protein [Acidobacteria bacterium]|nr:peptidoglycan DD-metalloendopeptidase family protein [Acidobacteriota bacterium]
MIALLLAVASLTASVGHAVQVALPHEPEIRSMYIEWQSKRVPFVLMNDKWITVIGIDLDVKPGEHAGIVHITRKSGSIEKHSLPIVVKEVSYPTTELQVADEFVELSPANQKRTERETREINAIYSMITPQVFWKQPFAAPISGRTGTNFGHRRVFNGQARNPHNGADLRAATGTPVRSTNRGNVVLAKNLFFSGNTVIVDHGIGVLSLYAHLSRIDVKKGDIVEQGQIVGLAGATGRVTGPHLHWGVRIQGARVDPFSLVKMGQ